MIRLVEASFLLVATLVAMGLLGSA
eukprot:COSAG02_NODE_32305_length_518_cov_1.231504_1_plen_24_part_01